MRRRHLFLTGDKQVGKSTLIRSFLSEYGIEAAGYQTLPFCVDGQRKGYILHSLVPLAPMENDCPAVIRMGERRHTAVLPVFETIGVKVIEESLSSSRPLILMDELGKSERQAGLFLDAVARCLNGPKPILGVLQRGEYPFFDTVSTHQSVRLLEVTQENREACVHPIAAWARENGLIP